MMELEIMVSRAFDPTIKAVGNTLLHSLWQGILLAGCAALITVVGKKWRPGARYTLLTAAFLLFAIGMGSTFLWQLHILRGNGIFAFAGSMQPEQFNHHVTENMPVHSRGIAFWGVVVDFFSTYCPIIVLLWFVSVCGKSIQLIVGLYGVYRLKQTKVSAVSHYWQNKITDLSSVLHIKQTVSLLESGLAKVPMAIGHLKPVILIPVGLITTMTPAEVEAVLIHELAHIRRRDFMVNLLQSFMEVLFFFNPAVLWVSALIKNERENCCDDMAVEKTDDKLNYIRALVTCQEYQDHAPAYAMALKSNKGQLLRRVNRLVGNTPGHSTNLFEKTLISVCLVGAICFSAGFSLVPSETIHMPLQEIKSSTPQTNPSQIDPGKPSKGERVQRSKIIAELFKENLIPNKNKYTIHLTNTALYINGVKQSKARHQRILKKYVRNPEARLNYTSSTSVSEN